MARKLIVFALLFVAIVGSNAAGSPTGSPMPATGGGSSSQAPEAGATAPVASAPKAATTPASAPKASAPSKSTPIAMTPMAETPDEEPSSPPAPGSEEAFAPLSDAPVSEPVGSPDSTPSDEVPAGANALKIPSALVVVAIAGFLSL